MDLIWLQANKLVIITLCICNNQCVDTHQCPLSSSRTRWMHHLSYYWWLCSLQCTLKTHLLLIIFETVFNIYTLVANRSSQQQLGPFVGSVDAKEIFAQKYYCWKYSFCKLIEAYKQIFMWNLHIENFIILFVEKLPYSPIVWICVRPRLRPC